MATTAREESGAASTAAAAAAGSPSCTTATSVPDADSRHARTLSWSSIAKSLLAGGIAGGV